MVLLDTHTLLWLFGDSENLTARVVEALRKYRAIKVVSWRVNFLSGALADFEGLLAVNRKICKR